MLRGTAAKRDSDAKDITFLIEWHVKHAERLDGQNLGLDHGWWSRAREALPVDVQGLLALGVKEQ